MNTGQQFNSKRQQTEKPVTDFWYGVQSMENDILWIREVFVDNYSVGDSWLLRGAETDLLIDTCSGIVPLAPLVTSISNKPVLAMALNDSYDHCGGWADFLHRGCHPLDVNGLGNPGEQSNSVSDYLDDSRLFALPQAGYSTKEYALTGAVPTRLVNDGEVIDLGDRQVEVIHTPGRSHGGICLWEPVTGCLFTSDMLYDGDHGLAWPPSYPELYIQSLKKLLDLPVQVVHGGHYGYFDSARMKQLINQQIVDLS